MALESLVRAKQRDCTEQGAGGTQIFAERGNFRQSPEQKRRADTYQKNQHCVFSIRECADLALKRGENKISGEIVKYNNREFSNYLLNVIRDEAHSALPEFDSVIPLLPAIRKQVFSVDDFKTAYELAVKKGSLITTKGPEKVLELLFEYGVIGNAPKMRGKAVFRYEYPNATINFNEKIIIHRGLFGALQIF